MGWNQQAYDIGQTWACPFLGKRGLQCETAACDAAAYTDTLVDFIYF